MNASIITDVKKIIEVMNGLVAISVFGGSGKKADLLPQSGI